MIRETKLKKAAHEYAFPILVRDRHVIKINTPLETAFMAGADWQLSEYKKEMEQMLKILEEKQE